MMVRNGGMGVERCGGMTDLVSNRGLGDLVVSVGCVQILGC